MAEDRNGVAGYIVGAHDTLGWDTRLEVKWWPHLRDQYADSSAVSPAARTADQHPAFMLHHSERMPPDVARWFPAHVHMNLLPRIQRSGVGPWLLALWLDRVALRGATAVTAPLMMPL